MTVKSTTFSTSYVRSNSINAERLYLTRLLYMTKLNLLRTILYRMFFYLLYKQNPVEFLTFIK